jgi:ankyrin repeat protein
VLIWIALKCKKEAVKLLLNHRVNINTKASVGELTVLHLIIEQVSVVDVTRLLLDHKANINVKDNLGQTAVYLIAMLERETAVRLLLNHRANVNMKNNHE